MRASGGRKRSLGVRRRGKRENIAVNPEGRWG